MSARRHDSSHQRDKPLRTRGGTLGPVSDLERHLPDHWWQSLFNSVYLKTDGDVVENAAATAAEIDAILAASGLVPEDPILDLCCGQGRHTLELARRGFQALTGIDRSRYLIRLARRRAKQEGLAVSFHEGDARRFRCRGDAFRAVMLLGNSFGYFDRVEDDHAVLRSIGRALVDRGMVILDLADGDWQRENFEPRSWEWIDGQHFVCRERSLSSDQTRLISREVVVHAERGVIVDQFYAERLYSEATIAESLRDCGFVDVQVHPTISGNSTRGADLGMMARRILITASHPAVGRKRRGAVRVQKVSVLLGDPRRPDPCKRNGQFNPEDLETVARLKAALAELNKFDFEFLDDHAGLLDHLRDSRPRFVLNLCDEGFDNDPFKELHVPAMLEMFGIRYSGAGPAALGLCYNKSLVRSTAVALEIPVPLETYLDPADQSATLPSIFPALVKPNFGDSSVGITQASVVDSPASLIARVDQIRGEMPGVPLLVQEYLTGHEYSVGVLGNPDTGLRFLPVLMVDYSGLPAGLPRILGYESKWLPQSPYWTQIHYRPADLDEDTARRLCDHSALLFERLGCRDYARFDFRADSEGEIKLLEVNPNPGWCWDGKLNMMAGYAGLSYAELLQAIIEAALNRVSAPQPQAHGAPG